jgi:guanylate kinase
MTGSLFILCAPSGAGKTSLVKELLAQEPAIRLSVSYTTRPPRAGERDGVDYHFVSREEFLRREAAGEFLESAFVHGNHYGTSLAWIERQLAEGDVLLEIDWQGAAQVRRLTRDSVSIFILPPSFAALGERLRTRGLDSETVIASRLAAARDEMRHVAEFDYVIINDDFGRAVADLRAVVHAARLRTPLELDRRHGLLNGLLGMESDHGTHHH